VSGNPNGEAEKVEVKLSQSSTARKKIFTYDFAELEIKGRRAGGNIISKYPLKRVDFLKAGGSTLSKLTLWYDDAAGRLNKDKRGKYLGKFDGEDKIIAFQRNGSYKITNYDLNNRYEPEKTLLLEKFNPEKPVSAVYVDGESKQYMVKRFMIETSTADKEFGFISEGIGSRLIVATTSDTPEVEMEIQKAKDKPKKTEVVNLEELVDIKGWKALGNRLSEYKVTKVNLVQEEETGLEEGDEENALVEAAEEDQSQKKKSSQLQQRGKQSRTTDKSASSGSAKSQAKAKPQATSKKAKSVQKSKSSSKTSSGKKQKAQSIKQKAQKKRKA
jgi:topoisomerase-4 subunit A